MQPSTSVTWMQPRRATSDAQTINLNPNKNDSTESDGCSNITETCPSQMHLWKDDEIKALLVLRFAKEDDFNSAKNHELLLTHITSELNNMGIKVSAIQAGNKFKTLKKKFKEVVDENSKTGKYARHWLYFEQFQETYGHKASAIPNSTYDSRKNDTEQKDSNNNEEKVKQKETSQKQKGRKRSSVDQLMSKNEGANSCFLEELKSQHAQKMQKMDRFLDI